MLAFNTAKKQSPAKCQAFFSFVGVAGFEPTTSSSRTTRATKLRYTPKWWAKVPKLYELLK
jgi:hypothetical protein